MQIDGMFNHGGMRKAKVISIVLKSMQVKKSACLHGDVIIWELVDLVALFFWRECIPLVPRKWNFVVFVVLSPNKANIVLYHDNMATNDHVIVGFGVSAM